VRHFAGLTDAQALFRLQPSEFSATSSAEELAVALGAALYTPSTRTDLARVIARCALGGVCTSIVDLEDAIADHDVPAGEANILREVPRLGPGAPLLFIRVRDADQITRLCRGLGPDLARLSGFVLPKFTVRRGAQLLAAVIEASRVSGHHLWAMPVMEAPEIIHPATRVPSLVAIAELLDAHRHHVLAVRIGATDISGAYGLRRDRDVTAYDVGVVRDVITAVVGVLGRTDGSGHVISGPVWEYYDAPQRVLKPQLRSTPFDSAELRSALISSDLDGLIGELVLDKANGLLGKTVIHPSHVAAVHSLLVVTSEEYDDAGSVLASDGGGVAASRHRNKMNEAGPHRAWAKVIMRRARAFGVLAAGLDFADVLQAAARAQQLRASQSPTI
jgi:citrate lyase beta subunit